MAMLRYQGAETFSVASTVGWVRSGRKIRVTTIGIVAVTSPTRRYCTTATTRSSPPSSRAMATRPEAPPATKRQRPGQRADVAVQAHQRAGGHADDEGAHHDGRDDRPVRTQRAERIPVHHGADVDAEHTLGGDACAAWHPGRSQRRQRQHDADHQRREQRGRRNSERGEAGGGGDGDQDQQRPAAPAGPSGPPPRSHYVMTSMPLLSMRIKLPLLDTNTKV